MSVERAEDEGPSSVSSPGSPVLTPEGLDEDGATGGSAYSSFSNTKAAPVCYANPGPEEGTSGEL